MKWVEKIAERHAKAGADVTLQRYSWASAHKDRGELLRRVEDLEAEVKQLGEMGNVCTWSTLRKVCVGCRCERSANSATESQS